MLLKQIAQRISEDTTKIIGFPVSISDENGFLIGVNDTSRIGLYDNLLAEVIKTKKLTYYNESAVTNYPDIFPGVASPIIVNDKVLGAVGIIGKTKEDLDTKNYILLVKNHIEMVCHEALKKEIRSLERNSIDTFIQYILNFDNEERSEAHIRRYSKMLNFELNQNRVCFIIQINPDNREDGDKLTLKAHDDFLDILSTLFVEKKDLIGRLTFEQFCILKYVDGEVLTDKYMKQIEKQTIKLNDTLHKVYNASAMISIGDVGNGIQGLQKSYHNALHTLETSRDMNLPVNLLDYNKLTSKFLIMMNTLPTDFFSGIEETFQPLIQHENYDVMASTFIVYCERKFNLSEAARNLYIHRNSLIYRLKQIGKIANIDIDNFNHCLLLYIFIKNMRA